MGMSDGIILPLQAQYAKRTVSSARRASKVAWIGAPLPYPPSEEVRSSFPSVEQHFLDPIAHDTETTRCFDANTIGWGRELAEQGFDMLLMFRVACHITDTQALVKELSDFLDSDDRTVVFEDLRGREKYKTNGVLYKFNGKEFNAPENHEQHANLIVQHFKILDSATVQYADPDITGLYLTLARKEGDQAAE